MKRKGAIATFLTLMLSSLVSAGPVQGVEQLLYGLRDIIVVIIQFISNIILDINSFDEFLFAKLIFLILIFLVIYVVISKNNFFGDNKEIHKVIAGAISILAVRFIPRELVEVLFLQYGALGAGLGIGIPFLSILFLLHQSGWGPLPRKIGWIFYGISYVAVFAYSSDAIAGAAASVYWAGIIGVTIAFFFDRQIHGAFGDVAIKTAKRGFESQRYADLQAKIRDITNQLTTGGLPPSVVKGLEKRREHFNKELIKIARSL